VEKSGLTYWDLKKLLAMKDSQLGEQADEIMTIRPTG
jgi:hypothetical protein